MFCRRCGNEYEGNYCPVCGESAAELVRVERMPSKGSLIATLIFGIVSLTSSIIAVYIAHAIAAISSTGLFVQGYPAKYSNSFFTGVFIGIIIYFIILFHLFVVSLIFGILAIKRYKRYVSAGFPGSKMVRLGKIFGTIGLIIGIISFAASAGFIIPYITSSVISNSTKLNSFYTYN